MQILKIFKILLFIIIQHLYCNIEPTSIAERHLWFFAKNIYFQKARKILFENVDFFFFLFQKKNPTFSVRFWSVFWKYIFFSKNYKWSSAMRARSILRYKCCIMMKNKILKILSICGQMTLQYPPSPRNFRPVIVLSWKKS